MTESKAQTLVFGALIVELAVVGYHDVAAVRGGGSSKSAAKSLGALFGLALILGLLATVAPDIAGPFAILLALSVILSRLNGTGLANYKGRH